MASTNDRLEASRRALFERESVSLALALSGRTFEGDFVISGFEGELSLHFGMSCNTHRLSFDLSADDFADIARIFRRAERRSRAPASRRPSVSQGASPVPAPLPSSI